jgi:hypothetical protein
MRRAVAANIRVWIFNKHASELASPIIIGSGVVALALILITRGRLNYERLAGAPSAEE